MAKLDKIRFAQLVNYLGRIGCHIGMDSLVDLDNLIEINVEPQLVPGKADANQIDNLMKFMASGTSKLDAIREYRAITGMGLKDSKDAVERYWANGNKYTKDQLRQHWEKQPMQQLDSDIILKFIEGLA